MYLKPLSPNGTPVTEEKARQRLLIYYSELCTLEPIGTTKKLLETNEAAERARKRACAGYEVYRGSVRYNMEQDMIGDFQNLFSSLPRLHKQWAVEEQHQNQRLLLTRSIYSEISETPLMQRIHLVPSTEREFVIKSTCYDAKQSFVESVTYVEAILDDTNTYSGILQRVHHVEDTTDILVPCTEPVQTSKSVCAILRERGNYLMESVTEFTVYVPPDARTLFSQINCNALPADCIFAGPGSAHAAVLSSIIRMRANGSINKFGTDKGLLVDSKQKQELAIAQFSTQKDKASIVRDAVFMIHVDEVNIRPTNQFAHKTGFYGPAHNDPEVLANHVQTFLLKPVSGRKLSMNLMSKRVSKMTDEPLNGYMSTAIAKAPEAGAIVCPIIFDGSAVNRKACRMLLLCDTSPEPPGHRLALPQQSLPSSVDVNGHKLFPLH
ncbi:hypothetical protein SARC_00565, partial [Sphaeroforma arctica JP610]